MNRDTKLQWIGVGFSLVLFACVEWVLFNLRGISFTTAFLAGSGMPLVVFVAGCVIGMAWEYVGQFALHSWHYPPVDRRRWLLFALPFFWGMFMLVMQDGYAIARTLGMHSILAAVVSTFLIGLMIEGINLYTRSWVYMGTGASPVLLTLGWVVFLAFTFIIGFNAFILNPFGL